MDYYAILEITSEATAVEVKDAYRRMSKKYHPDLNDNSPYYTEQFIRNNLYGLRKLMMC